MSVCYCLRLSCSFAFDCLLLCFMSAFSSIASHTTKIAPRHFASCNKCEQDGKYLGGRQSRKETEEVKPSSTYHTLVVPQAKKPQSSQDVTRDAPKLRFGSKTPFGIETVM